MLIIQTILQIYITFHMSKQDMPPADVKPQGPVFEK